MKLDLRQSLSWLAEKVEDIIFPEALELGHDSRESYVLTKELNVLLGIFLTTNDLGMLRSFAGLLNPHSAYHQQKVQLVRAILSSDLARARSLAEKWLCENSFEG